MCTFDRQMLKIVTLLGWMTTCSLAVLEGKLLGDHVCHNEITVPQEIVQWELKNRTTRTYQWCMSVPPRCSVYSHSVLNETRVTVINVTKSEEVCCEGYVEQNNFCVSLCRDCQNGLCIRGSCTCQTGWRGPRCDTRTTSTLTSESTILTITPEIGEGGGHSMASTRSDYTHIADADYRNSLETDGTSFFSPGPSYIDTTSVTEPILLTDQKNMRNIELMAPSMETVELDKVLLAESTPKVMENSNTVEGLDTKLTTLIPPTVLAKPSAAEPILPRGNPLERFEKRSSTEQLRKHPQLTLSEPTSKNLIYSVCAASLTTFFILVVAITLYAVRNSRKKVERHKTTKDAATVAVYSTSIFHSPLPDPPMFDNPTYLATKTNGNSWNHDKRESIDIQELNVAFEKPMANPKLDSKQYFYDHPPSTGSYRASSEVDTFSHYNLNQKSISGIVMEPVYDEIPSKPGSIREECEVTNNADCSDLNSRVRRNNVDSNCLYMNTCGRTKF